MHKATSRPGAWARRCGPGSGSQRCSSGRSSTTSSAPCTCSSPCVPSRLPLTPALCSRTAQTRLLTRVEAIITQLVFEHALRMRMKADVSDDAAQSSGDTTLAGTPDTASVAGSSAAAQEQGAGSESGSGDEGASAVGKGKQKATPQDAGKAKVVGREEKPKPADEEKKGKNVVGKINNLISSDLNSIGMGREFLMIRMYPPVPPSSSPPPADHDALRSVSGQTPGGDRTLHVVPVLGSGMEVRAVRAEFVRHRAVADE